MASELIDICGFKMEKIYKSSKLSTEKFGKKLIINTKIKTGDPYLDAAISLASCLSSVYPLKEICTKELLSRSQEETLKKSKFVSNHYGMLAFHIPSQILDNVPYPTICFTSTNPQLEKQTSENCFLEVVKVTDNLWICAY